MDGAADGSNEGDDYTDGSNKADGLADLLS
jgi:hypothetical protein